MAVDTSIYAQQRPFKLDDPLDQFAKVAQVRQAQRQFALDDDLSRIGRETGGDPARMSAALLERGHVGPALQLRSQAASAKKAEIEQSLKIYEAVGSDAMALDTLYRQALQGSGGNQQAAIARVQPAWAQSRTRWASIWPNLPETYNPDLVFASIGQAKEAAQYLKTLQPEYGAPVSGVNPKTGSPEFFQPDKQGGPGRFTGVAPAGQPTELSRLTAERDALPDGDPRRAQYDRVIASYKAGRGAGDVTVNMPGPMQPGRPGQNQVDEDMLNTTRNLMRLDTIAGQFKPEFQTLATRGSNWWNAARESLGANLKVKEKQDLTEFSQYKRNAIDSLNNYIKSITGAAMTDAEAQRILKGLPNPGTGLFDGDSPTEFKAKLDDAMKQTRLAVARLAYIKRNGMSLEDGLGKGLTLDRIPALMNERGKAIEDELRVSQPDAKGEALARAVRRQLGVEFGLSSD